MRDHFYVYSPTGRLYCACDLRETNPETLMTTMPDGGQCDRCAVLVAQAETAATYATNRAITPVQAVSALNMPPVVRWIVDPLPA
jgi:hypothetical protein